jgi:TRAP-type mannitol/chloroaromatic compound transport system permease small subunit
MLVAQILTLITGVASVFLNKKILALAPAILCPMVTALMVYVGTSFRSWEISYQQGYWLTYPSMLLFIAAFTLSLLRHKKKTDIQASKN